MLEQFQVDWNEVKKPQLSQKPKKKVTKQTVVEEPTDVYVQLDKCYKFRIASLITQLGKQHYYAKFDPKVKLPVGIQQQKQVARTKEEALVRMLNQLQLSCRFVSRNTFQAVRQPLLSTMQIDIRGLIAKYSNDKKFQKEYEDLDDQDEGQKQREEQEDKLLTQVIQLGEEETRSAIRMLRAKNNLSDQQRIYIIQGEYFNILKDSLKKLNWFEVKDIYSQVYEFKFCYAKKFLLKPIPEQIVSRFQQTKMISTKYGLTRSLKTCFTVSGIDSNEFYPRCYDLSDEPDFEDFLEEYKFTWAENYLKGNGTNQFKIDLCIRLMNRRMTRIKEMIDGIVDNEEYPVVTPQEWEQLMQPDEQNENEIVQKDITEVMSKLSEWDPQHEISQGENIWVVKPCGMSRGRGVKYYRSLQDILAYVLCVKDVNFVVQKCVENLMTINKRKFDIRQWVIISDIQPLTIWMYNECYVRFCGVEYSTTDLKNRFAHLTNFSVQKHQQDADTESLMYTQDQFITALKEMGFDFQTNVRQKMIEYTIATMKACQKSVEIRKNTFEIFGMDFIIDKKCNPWLIEINSSPTFGMSTPVTERLVRLGLEDLGEFIVGHMFNKTKKQSYGGWELIYKQQL